MKAIKATSLAEMRQWRVSTTGAALLIEITEQAIGHMVASGHIPKLGHGEFEVVGLVQGALRHAREARKLVTKTASLNRVQDARTREIELRTARDAKSLVDINEVFSVDDMVIGMFGAELDGLAAACTRDLELRKIISDKVFELRQRVAARIKQAADTLEADGEAGDPDLEDVA